MTEKKIFDVAILGGGIGGCFSALRLSEEHSNLSTIMIDLGRPFGKRGRFLERALGCFPNSDGKLYLNNLNDVKSLVPSKKANSSYNWVMKQLNNICKTKLIEEIKPLAPAIKRLDALGYTTINNSYYQWKPESIHKLSKNLVDRLEENTNLTLSFDNQIFDVKKVKEDFIITTANGEIIAKKIIMAVGRSGWRWVSEVYKEFGLTMDDDVATYGVRCELPEENLKEFNHAHMSIFKDNLEIGPLSWNGTVIPEDHADVVISAFRSNEDRWKTDNVSFSVLSSRSFPKEGVYQMDRLSKLAFLLFNERVSREKIKLLYKKDNILNMIPEYQWIKDTITELEELMPGLIAYGSYHVPNILPLIPPILLGENLETEVDGLFAAGESCGLIGLLTAAMTGMVAADGVGNG